MSSTTLLIVENHPQEEFTPINSAEKQLNSIANINFDSGFNPRYINADGKIFHIVQAICTFVYYFFTFQITEAFRVFNRDPKALSRSVQLLAYKAANSEENMGKKAQEELFQKVNQILYTHILADGELSKEERFKYLITPTLWGGNWELHKLNEHKKMILEFIKNENLDYDAIEPERGISFREIFKDLIKRYNAMCDSYIFGLMNPSEPSMNTLELNLKISEFITEAKDLYDDVPLNVQLKENIQSFCEEKNRFINELRQALKEVRKFIKPYCPKGVVFLGPLFSMPDLFNRTYSEAIRDKETLQTLIEKFKGDKEKISHELLALPSLKNSIDKIAKEAKDEIEAFFEKFPSDFIALSSLYNEWFKIILSDAVSCDEEECSPSAFRSQLNASFEKFKELLNQTLSIVELVLKAKRQTNRINDYSIRLKRLLRTTGNIEQEIIKNDKQLLKYKFKISFNKLKKREERLFQLLLKQFYQKNMVLNRKKINPEIEFFYNLYKDLQKVSQFLEANNG